MTLEHSWVVQEDLPAVDNNNGSREHGPTHKMPKAGVEKPKPINITMTILQGTIIGITMGLSHMVRPKRSSRRIITHIRAVKDTKPPGKIGPKLKRKLVINENKKPNKRTINKTRVKEVAGSRTSVRMRRILAQDFIILELRRAGSHSLIRAKVQNMGNRGQELMECLLRSSAYLA